MISTTGQNKHELWGLLWYRSQGKTNTSFGDCFGIDHDLYQSNPQSSCLFCPVIYTKAIPKARVCFALWSISSVFHFINQTGRMKTTNRKEEERQSKRNTKKTRQQQKSRTTSKDLIYIRSLLLLPRTRTPSFGIVKIR